MHTLQHKFDFAGQLSQTLFPDLLLTTSNASHGNFIPAHRVVLSAVSTKLYNLCKEGGKVVIRNIEYKALEDVVEFIYKGYIQLKNKEDIENLRDGIDMLKVNVEIGVNGARSEGRVLDEVVNNNLQDLYFQSVCSNMVTQSSVKDMHSPDDKSNGAIKLDEGIKIKDAKHNYAENSQEVKFNSPDYQGESFTQVLESMSDHVRNKSIVISKIVSYEGTNKSSAEVPDEDDDSNVENMNVENENNDGPFIPDKLMEVENEDDAHEPKKVVKSMTKIPCDYCGESVTLNYYVNHCKKMHSIRNDEECKRKCFQCGAKVHIIAQKFHDQIYHPAIEPNKVKKSQPLSIIEHNKCLTKIVCDFCNCRVGFNHYRQHVKSKHPEINFKEQVKCGKCGVKVFKSAFKYHRQIFHKSAKVKSTPACDYVPRPALKMNYPCIEVKVELSEIKVDENEHYIDPGTTPKVDDNSENQNESKDSMEGTSLKGDLSE